MGEIKRDLKAAPIPGAAIIVTILSEAGRSMAGRVGTRIRTKVQGRRQIALMAEIRDMEGGIRRRPNIKTKAQLLPDTKGDIQRLPGLERQGRLPILST